MMSSVARNSDTMTTISEQRLLRGIGPRRLPTARCGYGSSTPNAQPDEASYTSPGTPNAYHATVFPFELTHCPVVQLDPAHAAEAGTTSEKTTHGPLLEAILCVRSPATDVLVPVRSGEFAMAGTTTTRDFAVKRSVSTAYN